MRLVVLFVVLLACQVFCQNELKNGACKLESAPSEGSYIKLKLKENTQNKQSAKFTFKGDTEEIIDLNLSNLGQDEFFLHVEVENLKYDCEIDEVGVTFEELTDKNDLKNGACKLKSAPALGSTLYLKLKQNTNNVDAKITLKGKDGKTDQKVNLKLKDSVQNEFEVPITVENLSDGCEIDDAGVTLEELLAQKVGLNSEFTLVGPATQAELTFQATSEKPLFVRTEFVGTGSTDLRVKTANPLALDISVRGQDNLLHVQGTDLTKDANIKITIKRLKATEKLIFQTTDTFDITTLSGKTLHYVCSRDGCEFTFDQKTVLTHLTVEKGATHTVNKGKPSEYKVTGGLKYIKTLKKNSDVFERGQIFITLKPQAVALAVFIENETRVEGPVEANELELKYSQPLLLLTSGTDSTSLEVTTGTRNTLDITLERERSNLLQAPKNNNKKIKIKDLKEKESLTFKILNRSNYQLPMDTTLHYACTDACFLPSQNKERLMLFTVLQRWPEVAVNEGIENKEVKVNQDTSYIKLSRGKEKFGKGQILMNFASKSDAFDLKTKNLVFEGKEASGFWRLPKEKRAFDLKVTEQTNLTFSVNNKLALKETDMLKTVSFSPSRKEFFYISKQEAQSRFSFRIKANKETKVEIMDSQNLPTEVSLEPGTSNILDETKVGFINRPKDQKQIELNVHSSPQSAIKVDSRLFDLSDFFSTRLRVEDFGNRDYIWLKVFGSKDIHVDRIDKNAAYRIQERENKLSASQEIDIPYSINGYTLYINNSLKNSGVVDLKFEENPKMPRRLEKSSTKRVFLYEEDYGRKEFIRAKVLLEQGKEVIVKGNKRIETFQLENRDYYVKKNKAFFQPENAEYDYYFKFRLNDSTDSLAIDFLNKRFLLKDTESFKTIKVLKNEHKGQPIEVSFTSQKPSKEVHVTVAIQVAPCSKNTCENDGKCVDGQDDNYTCECKDGYEGERCEIKKENEEDKNSSPRSKAAVWMIVGVASFFFLMN